MRDVKKLARVRGKKLIKFCDKILELRQEDINELDILEKRKKWNAIKDSSTRSSYIISFLAMKGFTNEEIRKIEKHVFPAKRIFIPIILFLVLAGIGVEVLRGYQFYRFPRIYVYGNNIPVFSDSSLTTKKSQLDIFEQSFTAIGGKPGKSASSMIVVDSTGPLIKVRNDNILDHLFLFWIKKEGFVNRNEIIFSKNDHRQYEEIFKALKGDSTIVNLDNRGRKIIYDVINRNSSFSNSVLADDYPKNFTKPGFSKLLHLVNIDSNNYILLRLKTPVDKKNIVIKYDEENNIEVLSISEDSQFLNTVAVFKKDAVQGIVRPDIILFEIERNRYIKSPNPPYNIFSNTK